MEKASAKSLLKPINLILAGLLLLCGWQAFLLLVRDRMLEVLLIDSVSQWGIVASKTSDPNIRAISEGNLAGRIVALADLPERWVLDKHQRHSAILFGLRLLSSWESRWLSSDGPPEVNLPFGAAGEEFERFIQQRNLHVNKRLRELVNESRLKDLAENDSGP